ncbi:MAG: hypothetical protein Q9187_003031 [Circinaria calcarea]
MIVNYNTQYRTIRQANRKLGLGSASFCLGRPGLESKQTGEAREAGELSASNEVEYLEDWKGDDRASEHEDRGPILTSLGRLSDPRTVHILGSGNVGQFVAHALAGIPNPPPVKLLLHHRSLLIQWRKSGQKLVLITNRKAEERTGYGVELALPPEQTHHAERESNGIIQNLIVSVKTPNTAVALSSIAHRLNRDSTVLFLQNGMGVLDEVNAKVFPNEETRPNYMLGVVTHGLYADGRFRVIHAGIGTIAIGVTPRLPLLETGAGQEQAASPLPPSSRYLLRTLTRTPVLAAVGFLPADLLQYQIEKLVVNAVINPLTVMFDCMNGELLCNFAITRVMRLLLSEISLVVRSLPELQRVPNVQIRFAPEKLEGQVAAICKKTSTNVSSMLQDVRRGRQTEIDYINGYIVRRGEELGIRCVLNYMLAKMVRGKQQMIWHREGALLPLSGEQSHS